MNWGTFFGVWGIAFIVLAIIIAMGIVSCLEKRYVDWKGVIWLSLALLVTVAACSVCWALT